MPGRTDLQESTHFCTEPSDSRTMAGSKVIIVTYSKCIDKYVRHYIIICIYIYIMVKHNVIVV